MKIEGNRIELERLILGAFRYALPRHITQAMLDIQGIIIANIGQVDSWVVEQMVCDIEHEIKFAALYVDASKNSGLKTEVDTDYLKPLLKRLKAEMESRKWTHQQHQQEN